MLASVLIYIILVWLSEPVAIVSIDPTDYKLPLKQSSTYGNGWQPVINYNEINFNSLPSNKLQQFTAPLHPVVRNLQENIGSSDTPKSQIRNRSPEFITPTILGSFSFLGHAATKKREEPSLNVKRLPSDSRKHTFLLPPSRDPYHFQDTKFISETRKPDVRDIAPAYPNWMRYSSTQNPSSSKGTYLYEYNVHQMPKSPNQQSAIFDYQNSNKQFLVPPNTANSKDFGKNTSSQKYYNQNYNSQNQPFTSNVNNNFYNYVNHPNPYNKMVYERNPAYQYRETHDTGYATPSFEMNYEPSYQNYILPPKVYTSTLPPSQINYLQQRQNTFNANHSEGMSLIPKNVQEQIETFRKIRPENYKQVIVNNTHNPYIPHQEADFVYIPPETRQYFGQTIIPIEQTTEKEYETPESVSLKHYTDKLTRLATQENRDVPPDYTLTNQQQPRRQHYDNNNKYTEDEKLVEKQQRLKNERERTRGSGNKRKPAREEYQIVQSYEPQVVSNHRNTVGQGKTVSEQPTTSRHPASYESVYQTTQSSPKQNYRFSPDYQDHNVQHPQENFNNTNIKLQRHRQKESSYEEPQIVSLYPESAIAEVSNPSAEITESVTKASVFITTLPEKTLLERTTIPSAERLRNHKHSGNRTKRPIPTTQAPRSTVSRRKQEFYDYQNLDGNFTRRNKTKEWQSNYEEPVVERKPNNRRRPEFSAKLKKNEANSQTEATRSSQFETTTEVIYPSEYPSTIWYQETTPTESTELITENLNFVYITEDQKPSKIQNSDFVSETTRPTRVNNLKHVTKPSTSSREDNYERVTEPIKLLRVKNYEQQKTDYNEFTTPITTTTPFTTTKELRVSTTTTPSVTRTTHRGRPSKFGNTLRPRFSVKEYKTRLNNRNKTSQESTSDASTETSQLTHKSTVDFRKKQQIEPVRNTTGRYKYTSRFVHKTSSTTPATENQTNSTLTTYNRNKINKFSPKQRPKNNYLYRSRTTSTVNLLKQDDEANSPIQSGNTYSSPIKHRSSVTNNRLKSSKEPSESRDEIEMATEETSFYFQPISQLQSIDHQINEVYEEKTTLPSIEGNKNQNVSKNQENIPANGTQDSLKVESEFDSKIKSETVSNSPISTTYQSDKELFEKASQSVADLTSSASALYNKPGLFKAVSPSSGNRVISNHFKVTNGEPTLPIEAFFRNLSEKV